MSAPARRPKTGRCWSAAQPLCTSRRCAPGATCIGVVMQDEPLFSGSMSDNISLLRRRARPGLGRALRAAGGGPRRHRGDADGLPDAHRRHGRRRCRAGRSSACLLARALYKQPKVLLLDEATSALDVDRERAVNQAVAPACADARRCCASARDDRRREPRHRAAGRPRRAGPSQCGWGGADAVGRSVRSAGEGNHECECTPCGLPDTGRGARGEAGAARSP